MIRLLLSASLALTPLAAQELGNLDAAPARVRQYVAFAAEQQTVPAGRNASLDLHFRVLDGFHINSHLPKSELLIPTQLVLDQTPGVKLAQAEYPAGQPFSLSLDPSEKLDVYAAAFTITLPVVAAPGAYEIRGALKYQACNRAACYPPRTLPVTIVFTAL